MTKLLVKKSGALERELDLGSSPVTIGRSAENDLVLLDVSVSRRHARIEPVGQASFRIVDLGSGNGILHDGKRVEQLELYAGCSVELGDYTVEVEVEVEVEGGPARTAEPEPESASKAPRLVLIGGGARRAHVLGAAETVVGRSKRAAFSIDDPLFSGEHFKIVEANGQYALVDLESANGTFVNGVRVRERELSSGDQIRVAGITFYFAADGVEPEPGAIELIEPTQSPSPSPSVRLESPPAPISAKAPPSHPRASKGKTPSSAKGSMQRLAIIGGGVFLVLFLGVIWILVRSPDGSAEREFQEVFQANLSAEARERIAEYEASAADYEARGNLELALEQYRKILALDPTHQSALAETGRMEEELERALADRARDQQEQSERLTRVAELTEQAAAQVAQNQFGEARRLLEEASAISPDSGLVQERIVSSYLAEGDYLRSRNTSAARNAYAKALELDPNSAPAKSGIQRIDAGRQAARQEANRVDELTETGLTQLRRESFRDAYQTFSEVLKLDPANARAKEFRDQARALLDQQVRPMYDEGVRLFNAGELAAAMAQFQRLRELHPDHPDTRAFLAREMDKVRAEAVDRYKRAYIYEGLGRLRDALVLYQESLALLPDPSEEYHQKASERIADLKRKIP